MNLQKLALASATLAAALSLAVGLPGLPALSLGWYAGAACDDALAQNPGDPAGCRYGARERACGNGVDDDSDEAADAADADCGGYCGDGACAGGETPRSCDSDCGCPPWSLFDSSTWTCGGRCAPSELDTDGDCASDFRVLGHACADGEDNDRDGAADCADPDCERAFPACLGGYCGDGVCGAGESWCGQDCGGCLMAESAGDCANGLDDDCDNLPDCADPECAASCQKVTTGAAGSGASSVTASFQSWLGGLYLEAENSGAELPGAGPGGSAPGKRPSGAGYCGDGACAEPEKGWCKSDCPDAPQNFCPASALLPYGPLNSCHDSANAFCDALNGVGWDTRVVKCQQGDGVTAHTINLYLNDPAKSEWCLIEPQDGTTCCFTDYACSASDISLASGTHGGVCAQAMCKGQYKSDECRVLPADERALSEAKFVEKCAVFNDQGDPALCLDCCAAVTQDLEKRWFGDWSGYCPANVAEQQSRILSDLCVAGCSPDRETMTENLLNSLPKAEADQLRNALGL